MYLFLLAFVSVLIIGLELLFGFRRGLKLSLYRLVMILLSIVFTAILVPLLARPLTAPVLSLLGYSGLSLQEFFVKIIQDTGFTEGAALLSLPLTGIALSLFGTILFPMVFWLWKLIGFIIYLVTKSKIDKPEFLPALNRENRGMKPAGLAVGLVVGLLTGGITMMPFICLQGLTENEDVQALASGLLGEETSEIINIYENNPVKYLYRFTAMEALSKGLGKISTRVTVNEYRYSAYSELPFLADFTKDFKGIIDKVSDVKAISELELTEELVSSAKTGVLRVMELPYYNDDEKASLFRAAFQKVGSLDTSKDGVVRDTLNRIPMNTLPEVRTNVNVMFDLLSFMIEEDIVNAVMNASVQELKLTSSNTDSLIDIIYGFTNASELIPDVMNLLISSVLNNNGVSLLKRDALTSLPIQKDELREIAAVVIEFQDIDPNQVADMSAEKLVSLKDMVFILNDSPLVDEESLKSLYTPYFGDIDLEKYREMDGASLKDMLNE